MNDAWALGFLRRPVAVAMCYAVLVLCGIFAFTQLPIDLAPVVEFPALTVRTTWPGVSAEAMEMLVTAPIEEAASTVRGVRNLRSISREGDSEVALEFEHNTEMGFVRLELNEKLAALAVAFPAGVEFPVLEPFVPAQFRELQGFLTYTLAADRPASELRKFGREVIAPRLASVRGVASVGVFGGEEREIHIELRPDALAALGLDPDACTSALVALECDAAIAGTTAGISPAVVSIRNAVIRLEDLEQVTIAHTEKGTPIRIRDVGTVRRGTSEPREYYRIGGKQGVTLVINKQPHVNTLRVADAVLSEIEEMGKQFPEGIRLLKELDQSSRIRRELHDLFRDAVLSVLCILAVLVLFLGEFRGPFVVVSAIVFSLAGTFLIFWILGIGLHLLSFGGLVLGFGRLVDDSIVVLDNIRRRFDPDARIQSTSRALREIALPVVASTLTTCGALGPTAFLPEDLRPYFLQFSAAVAVSLLMSLVVSFTFLPLAMSRLQRVDVSGPAVLRVRALARGAYAWMLHRALRHRVAAILTAVWLFGIPVWLLPERLEGEGLWASCYNSVAAGDFARSVRPAVNALLGGASRLFFTKVNRGEVWEMGSETYLVVYVEFPQGTDLERYDAIAKAIERDVLAFGDGIERLTCRVDPDRAVLRVDFSPASVHTRTPYLLKNRLTMFAARTGGATIGVSGFGPGYYNGGQNSPAFAIRVLGYNYNQVKELASEFRTRIMSNPRVAGVDCDHSWTDRGSGSTELVARIDRDRASSEGVTVGEVMHAVRTHAPGTLQGSVVSVEGERLPCTVKFRDSRTCTVDDLRAAAMVNKDGKTVRLAAVLTLMEEGTPGEILRENQQYVRWVSFEYRGPYRYGSAYVDAAIRAMSLPPGYRFERMFSSLRFSDEQQNSMLLIAGISLLLVYMITASLYESFVKPFIVILSVPFSLIGLFVAFSVAGVPFGRGGYASVILLTGIVVTNAIILVDWIAREISRSGGSVEVLVLAASDRVRPVVMTTLATIGGLLPFLVFGERTGIWFALALGTIGGLTSSMVLTLLLVPVIYAMIARIRPHTAG